MRPDTAVPDVEPGSRPSGAAAVHAGLRAGGVGFAVSLPDSILNRVTGLVDADPDILSVRCTREDEGVAMAFGAWLGGRFPVALMEGSGIGYCGLVLARAQACRIPLLLIGSHNKLLAEEYDYHLASAHAAEGVLGGLDIPYAVVTKDTDLAWTVASTVKTCRAFRSPRALLLPPGIV